MNRKKTKILCVLISMILACIAVPSVHADESASVPKLCDFEDCEIGNVPEDITVNFTSDSNISVQYDEVTGSKALRFEIGSIQGSNIATYKFSPTREENLIVSYDLRMENHSRWALDLEGWGSLYNGSTRVVRNTLYNNNLIGYGAWGTPSANSTLITALNTKKDSFKVEMYLDFKTHTYTTFIDGVQKSAGSGMNFVFQNVQSSINSVVFSIRKNANASGTSNDGTSENKGVYWVDNIRVEKPSLKVTSTSVLNNAEKVSIANNTIDFSFNSELDSSTVNYDTVTVMKNNEVLSTDDFEIDTQTASKLIVRLKDKLSYSSEYTVILSENINKESQGFYVMNEDYILSFNTIALEDIKTDFYEDFEEYSIGSVPKSENLIFNLQSGSSFTVENDPTVSDSDNKSLKMTVGSSSNLTKATYKFDETINDKINVSYDFRAEKHNRSFYSGDFGSVGKSGQNAVKGISYKGSGLYFFGSNSTDNASIMLLSDDMNYKHVDIAIDLSEKKFQVWVDGVIKSYYNGNFFGFYNDVSSLNQLVFSACYDASSAVNGSSQNEPGVYWIDNIKVEPLRLNVTSSTINDGDEGINARKNSFTFNFNSNLDSDSDLLQYVNIYLNNEKIDSALYSLSAQDSILKIDFVDFLEWESNYRIEILKEINENNDDLLQMKDDKIISFTTIDEETGSIVDPIVFKNDFEEIPVGTSISSIGGLSSSGNVTVDNDEDNRGIKMEGLGSLSIKFPDTSEKKVIISYRFKPEKHTTTNGALVNFGSVGSSTGSGEKKAVRAIIFNNSMLAYFMTNTDTANAGIVNLVNPQYHTMKYVLDMENQSFELYVDGVKNTRSWAFWDKDVNMVNNLTFTCPNADSVYWIDDIDISYDNLKLTKSDPVNNAVRVNEDKNLTFSFDEKLDASTVNQSTVRIFKNGERMSEDSFSVSLSDENTISVKMNENMADNSHYKVFLSNKIAAQSGRYVMKPIYIDFDVSLREPYKITKNHIGSLIPGTDLKADYTILNLSSIDEEISVVIIGYDESGAISMLNSQTKEIKSGKSENFNPSITLNADTVKAIIYTWKDNASSFMKISPISEAKIIE